MSRQLNVTEAQTHLSTKHVGQAVVVGRDDAGEVTMRMTPAAAEALAEILTRYRTSREHLASQYVAEDYDADLWVHVGVDLLAAKAMQLSLGHVETSPVSGYLPPRSAEGAAALAGERLPIANVITVTTPSASGAEIRADIDRALNQVGGKRR